MSSFLNPDLLLRLEGLRLFPRFASSSTVAGSLITRIQRGTSTEFVDYKSYTPGDDPRHIDWKVYGRRDRYFLRSYEGETNYTLWVLLDASRSMTWRGPRAALDKWSWVCQAALGLIYLALKNRNASALLLFGDQPKEMIEPRLGWEVLSRAVELLDHFSAFTPTTDFARSISGALGLMRRRSLVLVFSDCLGESADHVAAAMEMLAAQGHEVVCCRVTDPAERTLEGLAPVLTKIISIEDDGVSPIELDGRDWRELYLERWQYEEKLLERRLAGRSIDYRSFETDQPLAESLVNFLAQRFERHID